MEAEKGDWSPDLDPFKLTERTDTSTDAARRHEGRRDDRRGDFIR